MLKPKTKETIEEILNLNFYQSREPLSLKKEYRSLLKRTYNKDLDGYIPDEHSNITSIYNVMKILIANYKEVVVFAIDGISYKDFVGAGLKYAPNSSVVGALSSVFPSTTGSAWPSILTGASPSEHGIYGTSFLLKKYDENYIWISGTLNHKGTRKYVGDQPIRLSLTNKPTIFEYANKCGIKSHYIGTHGIGENNQFRELLTRGASHHEAIIQDYAKIKRLPNKFVDYFMKATTKYLDIKSDEKKLIWNYIDLDDFLHERGYEALEKTNFWQQLFSYWSSNKNNERAFVFISDHGQVEQSKFDYSILKAAETNDDLAYNTGGAGRTLYFYPKPGKHKKIENWVRNLVGDAGKVFHKNDLVEKYHLFSKKPHGFERVGEIVAIGKTKNFPAVGCSEYIQEHGALQEEEMFVPILILG